MPVVPFGSESVSDDAAYSFKQIGGRPCCEG
jgi:hypothetical protein